MQVWYLSKKALEKASLVSKFSTGYYTVLAQQLCVSRKYLRSKQVGLETGIKSA